MNPQWKRRFWLFVHECLVHPFVGLAEILSPSTNPRWANRLHDWSIPPQPTRFKRLAVERPTVQVEQLKERVRELEAQLGIPVQVNGIDTWRNGRPWFDSQVGRFTS